MNTKVAYIFDKDWQEFVNFVHEWSKMKVGVLTV